MNRLREPPPPSYDEVMGLQERTTTSISLISTNNNTPVTSVSYNTQQISQNYQPQASRYLSNDSYSQNGYTMATNSTLKPYPNFDIKADIQKLEYALKAGSIKKKDILIEILCKRTSQQRREISLYYEQFTGRSLIQEIKHRTSGNFYIVMCGLVVPYYEYLARCLHRSNRMRWLYYLLPTLPNDEIISMKRYFETKYKVTIERFISAMVHSDDNSSETFLVKPMTRLLEARRNERITVVPEEVSYDVERLMKIRCGTIFSAQKDEKEIIKDIFYYKSINHIRAVSESYTKQTKTTIYDAFKKCYMTGRDDVFKNIARYALNPNVYFSYLLKSSMKGLGTDDLLLIHIINRRSEIDLGDIRNEFKKTYGNLRAWVKDDTSGYYKYALYELMGEKRSR